MKVLALLLTIWVGLSTLEEPSLAQRPSPPPRPLPGRPPPGRPPPARPPPGRPPSVSPPRPPPRPPPLSPPPAPARPPPPQRPPAPTRPPPSERPPAPTRPPPPERPTPPTRPPPAPRPPECLRRGPLREDQEPLDLEGDYRGYNNFLNTLRCDVVGETVQGIMMMAKPGDPMKPDYLTVELKASDTESITLAIDKNYLYVVAYKDKVGNQDRAHFFPDAPSNAKQVLFKEVTDPKLRLTINYKSNYRELENKAGGDRRKTGLGIKKLKHRLERVYGSDLTNQNNVKAEAEFLLIAIQTVAEAARFRYIENRIVDNFNRFEFTPDHKVINLQNEWGKISKAIRGLGDEGTTFNPPLRLKDAQNRDWVVTQLSQIQPDMGLLKYEPRPRRVMPLFSRIMMIFLGIDVDNQQRNIPVLSAT